MFLHQAEEVVVDLGETIGVGEVAQGHEGIIVPHETAELGVSRIAAPSAAVADDHHTRAGAGRAPQRECGRWPVIPYAVRYWHPIRHVLEPHTVEEAVVDSAAKSARSPCERQRSRCITLRRGFRGAVAGGLCQALSRPLHDRGMVGLALHPSDPDRRGKLANICHEDRHLLRAVTLAAIAWLQEGPRSFEHYIRIVLSGLPVATLRHHLLACLELLQQPLLQAGDGQLTRL
mmetsp:Transcript_80333/g.225437  ORF Transcript_80333/g.225437 Transcript_80333/m.225437 type:complete len:232 (-) Transcript_80333:405-1100(-)